MPPVYRRDQAAGHTAGLGLECVADGVALAGVPLLRTTPEGLAPRTADEITILLKAAYGPDVDPSGVRPALAVIAEALNRGDLGRAMVAAVQLKLPALGWDDAARLARADDILLKFNPDELRDWRGWWTTGGAAAPQPHHASLLASALRPLLMSSLAAANDNFTPKVCVAAGRICQVNALSEKNRSYFDSCWKAEDTCVLVQAASRLDPIQSFAVIYPDRTVVDIIDGDVILTHVGGVRLLRPLE